MTIYISEEDTKLFQDNGFSYEDVSNTVNHYRETGLSDEEIQNKINTRLSEFKIPAEAGQNWHSTEKQSGQVLEQPQQTYISSYKPKTAMENFTESVKWVNESSSAAWNEGNNQVRTADLEIKDMFNKLSAAEKKELESLNNQTPHNYNIYDPDYKYGDNYKYTAVWAAERMPTYSKRSYVESVKMLPLIWETMKRGGIGAAAGAAIGGTIGAARSLFTTKVDILPSAIQGASAGAMWGARITGGIAMAEFEAGLARNELKQINREIIEEGGEPLTDAQLNALALGVGVVNGGLEMISFKRLLKTVPGGDKIIKQLEKKNLKELARNKTVRQQLANVFKDYGKALATETTTEMLQETSNIVADFTARKIGGIEDDSLPDYLKKNSARVLETGIATFGATMFLGGFGTTAKTATILTKQGMTQKQAQKTAESMNLEEKKQFISENMDTLMETVKDIPSVQELEKREQLHENIKNDMVSGVNIEGIDDITLNDTARVFSESIANLAKSVGKNVDEVNQLFNIKYETLTDEQAIEQYNRDNAAAYEQSAMYKSPKKTFDDFYDQVQQEKNPKQKAYYIQKTNQGVNIDIFHDIVRHDEKKHSLSKKEWNNLFNSIDSNIEDKVLANKSYYKGMPLLLKVNVDGDYYGVSMEIFPNRNIITTAFKSTEKGINTWIEKDKKKSAGTTAPNHQSGSSIARSNNVISGQTLTDIINDIKTNLNPNVTHNEQHFQNDDVGLKPNLQAEKSGTIAQHLANSKEYEKGLSKNIITDYPENILNNKMSELQRKDGKTVNVEYYNNSDIKDVKPLNIRKLKFANVQNAKDIKKSDITKNILNGKEKIFIKNKKSNIEASLNVSSLKKIISTIYRPEKENSYTRLEKEIITNIETIFENAVPVLKHNELKNENLYDKQIIHRFALPIQIGDNNFLTMITVKERADFKELNIDEFSIYDLKSDLTIKKTLDRYSMSEDSKESGQSRSQMSSISMNDILDFVNSNLNKYKVSLNNNQNILFQSAYHGTPHRFDEFSLDNIGTGEGAQAHGWGLYFAEDKNVSEGYRRYLANDTFNNERYYYNNKLVEDITKKAILSTILENGKAKVIEVRERTLFRLLHSLDDYNKEEYEKKEKELKWIKSLDENKIQKKTDKGQLFEVDIPESDVLLDEDKTFKEQPEKVQKALKKLSKQYSKDNQYLANAIKENLTGKDLYYTLTQSESVDYYEKNNAFQFNDEFRKRASKKLNELGVKGITYDGRQDGRCYVIFDDKAIDVIKRYYQELDNEDYNLKTTEESIKNARGFTYQKTNFDGSIKENVIVLLKGKADKSTLLHEFSHIYLNVLNVLAKDNDKARDMLLTINKQLRYDGKEYTTQQHEKFAKMFEAYVKTGKAPTYRLKRVFEHFRKWMGDIYNGITNSDALEISPEWKKIFDELLGDISVDVQEQISENLIEKARNYADLKISKIQDSGIIHPKLLTEKQLRYRDTAYDIIFYALKHSKNEETRNYVSDINQLRMILGAKSTAKKAKGLAHQRERLELLLAESDDAFSAHDGFLPEWGEFFNDPGVSYDYQIQGADAKLALDALDVIVNKKYLTDEVYSELSENDVKRAEYELEYLLDDYKNAKDKTASMAAFYMWIENQHPYTQDDFLNKWEMKTNEIERYQTLDKWQQAKEDLKLQAAKMKGFGDYSTQFAEYARSIIKRLDFMSETDKSKLFDKLKDFNSFREVENNLDEIMDYAQTLYGMSERRHLAEDIKREVSRTVHEWQNGIKRTKYTYPANKLFERLRTINKMNSEEIQMLYDSMVNDEIQLTYDADKVHDEDYYKTIEKMFIEFKYCGGVAGSSPVLPNLLFFCNNHCKC